jgi:hypothetical protein
MATVGPPASGGGVGVGGAQAGPVGATAIFGDLERDNVSEGGVGGPITGPQFAVRADVPRCPSGISAELCEVLHEARAAPNVMAAANVEKTLIFKYTPRFW